MSGIEPASSTAPLRSAIPTALLHTSTKSNEPLARPSDFEQPMQPNVFSPPISRPFRPYLLAMLDGIEGLDYVEVGSSGRLASTTRRARAPRADPPIRSREEMLGITGEVLVEFIVSMKVGACLIHGSSEAPALRRSQYRIAFDCGQ